MAVRCATNVNDRSRYRFLILHAPVLCIGALTFTDCSPNLMGNRSFLYLVPAAPDADNGGIEIAEANNHFPTLWQIMLAEGDAAPAIDVQRVFGDAGTDNLASDAETALDRLRSIAEFIGRHPQLHLQPLLPLQFEALLAHLRTMIDEVRGDDGGTVHLSANLDELSWLDGEGTPQSFIHQCRAQCDQRWTQVREAMRTGNHALLDEALGLKTYGRDFTHWDAWAWEFGFSGLHHDYFHMCDEPRDVAFADFVPEPRAWENSFGDGFERFEHDGRWGVRWRDTLTGREREVLAPEWEAILHATYGAVWVVRDGLHGYARLDREGMQLALAPELDEVFEFRQDEDEGNPHCAVVRRGERYGLLAADGHWLFEPTVDEVWRFDHGYAPFRSGDREGFIAADGTIAVPAQYEAVSCFCPAGVAAVWLDDRAGLVRGDAGVVLAPCYDDLEWRDDLRAFAITQDEKRGLCRADGSVWVAPEWDEIKVLLTRCLIGVRRGDAWGVLDWQGQVRIAPRYHEIDLPYYDNLGFDDDAALAKIEACHKRLVVRIDQHVGMVDEDDRVLVPIAYHAVEVFEAQQVRGEPDFAPTNLMRIVERGKRRAKLVGVYDVDAQRVVVPCAWKRVYVTSFGQGEYGFLVVEDVPKRDRERLGDVRVGVLRADGSTLFPAVYGWLTRALDMNGSMWLVAVVRSHLHDDWGAGKAVQALRSEDGVYVWLHRDGREESHADYLARRYREDGDLDAAYQLGIALRDADGVTGDDVQSRHWLTLATGATEAVEAPSAWRKLLNKLPGTVATTEDRTPEPQPGQRIGSPRAMYALSLMLSEGRGGPEQPDTARVWLEYALAHGGEDDPEVLSQLGYLLFEGVGGRVDRARGRALYERAAERDSAVALHNLGIAYQYGQEVEIDLDRALEYFRRAERKGDASCAYHVGAVLVEQAQSLTGEARRKRLGEAAYALSMIIHQTTTRHADYACGEYARICLDPVAAEYSPERAEETLLRGAELDNAWCMEMLVDEFYANEASGRADPEQAARWTQRRAELSEQQD